MPRWIPAADYGGGHRLPFSAGEGVGSEKRRPCSLFFLGLGSVGILHPALTLESCRSQRRNKIRRRWRLNSSLTQQERDLPSVMCAVGQKFQGNFNVRTSAFLTFSVQVIECAFRIAGVNAAKYRGPFLEGDGQPVYRNIDAPVRTSTRDLATDYSQKPQFVNCNYVSE